jgi:hypothetical protein
MARLCALCQDMTWPIRVLDLGGTVAFWQIAALPAGMFEVTLLNREAPPTELPPGFHYLQGDARQLGELPTRGYDLVFSNSLIEHLGHWEQQVQFAREVQRIGKAYWVQTPYRHFPLEPHVKIPFFQYLPQGWQYRLLTQTSLANGRRYPGDYARELLAEIRLLNHREYRQLFPNARVMTERWLGLTKSLIAWKSSK